MRPYTPGFTGLQQESRFRIIVEEIIQHDPYFNYEAIADHYSAITYGELRVAHTSEDFLTNIFPTLLNLISICEHFEKDLSDPKLPLSKVFRGETLSPVIYLGCMFYNIFASIQEDDPEFKSKFIKVVDKYNISPGWSKYPLLSEEFKQSHSINKMLKILKFLSMFNYRDKKEQGIYIANDIIMLLQDAKLHKKNRKPVEEQNQ